jgi:hypothetical protein
MILGTCFPRIYQKTDMAGLTGLHYFKDTMKYYLLTLLFTFNALAVPTHTKVQAGDKVPFNGRLLNPDAEKNVKDKYSVLEQTVEVQKERLSLKDLAIDAKDKEADLWKAEAEKQAVEVQKGKNDLRNGVLMGVGGAALLMFLLNGVRK